MIVSSAPSLRFLGPIVVTRAGQPVALPKSQKTRALLAYLAVTGRPQLRERLSKMFWDVTDDPRAALRWSLSRLRALDDEGAPRILADRTSVSFDPAGAFVDALRVREQTADGVATLTDEQLESLVALFRGAFLEGLELPDFDEYEAWRIAEREQFRGLHARLLEERIVRLAEDPPRAVGPARELVRLLPDDEHHRARLVALLGAAGRRDEAEEHYSLGRRHLEKIGANLDPLRRAWRDASAVSSTPAPVHHAGDFDASAQDVRFCRSADGVSIAYATVGNGPPLVKTANWMTHLEYDWKSPLWRHLARELSREFRLIRYDQRGNGLSDAEVEDFSLARMVEDLAAVVDATGVDRFPLVGVSQGCRVAIAYAVQHPERVSHLVLYGGSARGWKHRPEASRARRTGLQALIRDGWGQDVPAFRQVFTTLFMPEATPEQAAWFNELQRASTSAENALRITEAFAEVDLLDRLAEVRAPTLVMHATRDAMTPFEEARILASGIPDARFVALESQNHLLLDDEPAFARFLAEIRAFVTTPAGA